MPLFAAHLLSEIRVEGDPPDRATKHLSIRVIDAADMAEAVAKARRIGALDQTDYLNAAGESVRHVLIDLLEVQELFDREFKDGMEVSYWMWNGDRLELEKRWVMTPRLVSTALHGVSASCGQLPE